MRKSLFLVILLAGLTMSAHADSILNGLTVSDTWYYPVIGSVYQGPVSAVVGPGVEFPEPTWSPGNPAMALDVSDTLDEITFFDPVDNGCCYTGATFNGFEMTVLSSFTGFTSVALVSSNWPGFDASRISIAAGGDGILIDMAGLTNYEGGSIVISYDAAPAVPEPMSLLLFGSGLAAISRRLGQRRRAT